MTTALKTTSPAMMADIADAQIIAAIGMSGGFTYRIARGDAGVWLMCALRGQDIGALRVGPFVGDVANVACTRLGDEHVCDFATPLGPVRARISLRDGILRSRTWLTPADDLAVTAWPRDLLLFGDETITIHAAQRGLRTGIVFGSRNGATPLTVWYLQNFSALNDYFEATKTGPADTVGGTWPEFGYAPPVHDGSALPKAREIAIGDAIVILRAEPCDDEAKQAEAFLDLLAASYLALDVVPSTYHHWPARAEAAVRHLSRSPVCSYVDQGRRYLMPYVADTTKPPESMVQFTLAVNVAEYDGWRSATSDLARALRQTVPTFFDENVGAIVRWLPGAPFGDDQSEDNMSHEAMDSWYIHHAAFNAFRLARGGDAAAKKSFGKTLPYLIRVAHRFDYRWPVFFDLKSIDVIRGESAPGKGGETDVGGLYALVMIHGYEMFGNDEYLAEARAALDRCAGLGFDLAYQLNTTGFAAEAALRLWKETKERRYLELSTVCMANIFNNMWLWTCEYGFARSYRTYFGLFPLRDAPYIAPYEELEAHAKFHEYIALGADDVGPALRLLIAEWQRYSLDRLWFYYPDALPPGAVAPNPRNGRIEPQLAVPLEDLHHGHEQSGQVGQEIYGAGAPLVLTTRHYIELPDNNALVYCDYSPYDVIIAGEAVTFRIDGDGRRAAGIRVIPPDRNARMQVRLFAGEGRGNELAGRVSPEGHAVYEVPGGSVVRVVCGEPSEPAHGLVIGTLF